VTTRRTHVENGEVRVLTINALPFNCQLCGKLTSRDQVWFFWKDGRPETRTCSDCGIKLAADHGIDISRQKTHWPRVHNMTDWERELKTLLAELEQLSYEHAAFAFDKGEHTPRGKYLDKLNEKRKRIVDLFWEVGELAINESQARVRRGIAAKQKQEV